MATKLTPDEARRRDRARCREYYIKNKERLKEKMRQYRKDYPEKIEQIWLAYKGSAKDNIRRAKRASKQKMVREYANSLKDNKPCTDCNEAYPYYVMDWDHVRGEKFYDVSQLTGWGNLQIVLDEIAKCDLVCANCHRVRTFGRKRHKGMLGKSMTALQRNRKV